MTVAALYVQADGVYAGLDGVEVWDEARDARLYAGPWPVVAHPPCNRWVSYGAQTKRGQDSGCFEAALHAVRTYGGVLEHPARSQAWSQFGLPTATPRGWTTRFGDPGEAIEVDQYVYGFPTRKDTWLYAVGIDPAIAVDVRRAARRIKGCDSLWSTRRSITPPAFRDVLLAMARSTAMVPA